MNGFTPPEPLATPVLFLIFNRPETTARVFEAIRQARPPRLYVAADGAREGREGEAERTSEVRRIATAVDWPCEVRTLFRDRNLGCRDAVSGAITWFFENEEEGIILEDDCLPAQSFFLFCEAMLERYRDDMRIGQVSGYNAAPQTYSPFQASYVYSAYGSIWGWATWKDRWDAFEPFLDGAKGSGLLDFGLAALPEDEYPQVRRRQLQNVLSVQVSTWDYQWFFARLVNSYLSVVPCENLVVNLGFGEDSTHTSSAPKFEQPLLKETVIPPTSPPCVLRDRRRDIELLDSVLAHRNLSLIRRIGKAAKTRLSALLLSGLKS
jgi:hypothetical protein